MKRFHDWPQRLHMFLASFTPDHQFTWGKDDCALFTCSAIAAMTGVDMAASFRGRYNSSAGAKKLLRASCGGGLEKLAEKMAALEQLAEVKPAYAQRGDVVLFESEQGPMLGVVSLHGAFAFFCGPQGAQRIPITACRRAWRIPA